MKKSGHFEIPLQSACFCSLICSSVAQRRRLSNNCLTNDNGRSTVLRTHNQPEWMGECADKETKGKRSLWITQWKGVFHAATVKPRVDKLNKGHGELHVDLSAQKSTSPVSFPSRRPVIHTHRIQVSEVISFVQMPTGIECYRLSSKPRIKMVNKPLEFS